MRKKELIEKCRITVIRKIEYADLMEKYENPIENTCTMKEGQIFVTNGWKQPEGFCQSAWDTLSPFVMALSCGAKNIYGSWMKNPASVMLSCNDGFRPVSFYVEAMEEEAE